MANNFISGHKAPVAIQVLGFTAGTLNVRGWSLDEEVLVFDVTHTGTGGRTARIAGKADHKGTVNADYDADIPPYLAPVGIRAGGIAVILFFVSPSKPIQVPVLITKVHYEAAIENEVKYSFEVAENVLAGVIVYPATPGA